MRDHKMVNKAKEEYIVQVDAWYKTGKNVLVEK